MPIDPQVLFEETKCYACYGLSLPELLKAGLLNRILSGGGAGGGGGAAAWGSITGTLSNQLDLQAALNAKTDLYTITFYNSAYSMLDSTTYFLGQNGTGSAIIGVTYNNVRAVIPITGTVIAVTLNVFNDAGGNGSAEPVTISLNKNNGTVLALAPTVSFAATINQLWSGLAFAVAQGDFLALQIDAPAWATNPTTSRMTGTIVIQKT